MIKVILKEDVIGQGKKNDIVDVSDGFARNFLIPRGKAVIATSNGIKKIEEEKKKINLKKEKIDERNTELKEKIDALEIIIQKKSKGGKLFGSIAPKEISETLSQKGIEINPKNIFIKEPLKTVGDHKIEIILSKNIRAILKLKVVEEK